MTNIKDALRRAHILKGRYVWILTSKWWQDDPRRLVCNVTTGGIYGTKKDAKKAADDRNKSTGRPFDVYDIQRIKIQ